MTSHLSAQNVARVLGIKTATLAKWRREGKGPKEWFHLSPTLVVYPAENVEDYLRHKRTGSGD